MKTDREGIMSIEHAFWRFSDLKERGIVNNRMTLHRWIQNQAFPQGILLGPNSRAWAVGDVVDWLDNRKTSLQANDQGEE